MTTESNWDQYEDAPSDSTSSSWDQYEDVREGIHLPKIGFGKKVVAKGRSPEEMRRTAARSGKVIGSKLLGTPGDIISDITKGANWIAGQIPFGKPKTEEELSSVTESPFISKSIQSGIEKVFPSTKPRTEAEKEFEEYLGLATNLLTPIPGGKQKAFDPGIRNSLYKAGQRLGLSEKDLAPITRGKFTTGLLSKLAAKSKEVGETIEVTKNALGKAYESLKSKPISKLNLSPKAESDLIKNLSNFKDSFSRGRLAQTQEQKAMTTFMDEVLENMRNHGATPEELMNLHVDLNDVVNWKSSKGGKRKLAGAKQFIMDAIKQTDPELARDFQYANKLWSNSESVLKSIGYKKFHDILDYSTPAAIVGALVYGNPALIGKIAVGYAGKQALSKISSKLLTDPKWQNIFQKSLNVFKNNNPKSAQSIISAIKHMSRKDLSEEEYQDLFGSVD